MRFASMQKCACMDMPMSRMAAGTSHELAAAVEVMKALASTARLAIVLELAGGPLRVHELVRATGMPQPRVSQELRVLRGAGIDPGARRVAKSRTRPRTITSRTSPEMRSTTESPDHRDVRRAR